METKNFTIEEVAHRPLPKDLIYIGNAAMQGMQTLRNMGNHHFGKDVPLVPTSGYRSKEYNDSLPNSAPNSGHIWREEPNGTIIWAIDFRPTTVSTKEYWEFLKWRTGGERYYHSGLDFIHWCPNWWDKKPWQV